MTALSMLIEIAVKTTILLALAGVLALALRGASPSVRHLVWSCAIVGLLAIPALTLAVPRWQLGLLPAPGASAASARVVSPARDVPLIDGRIASGEAAPTADALPSIASPAMNRRAIDEPRDWSSALVFLWLGGAIAGIITIIGGQLALRRVSARSRDLHDTRLLAVARSLVATLGINRPVRIIVSDAAAIPATWGVLRPTILLPADAERWDEDRQRVVLMHELAHVKRGDAAMQLVAQLCCATYWLHPGVWYAARKLATERELACDEHVIGAGIDACDYAHHLLAVATRFRVRRARTSAAIAMARPSQLEGRIVAMLSDGSKRAFKATARVRSAAFAGLFALTIPLAAMRPWKAGGERTGTTVQPSVPVQSTSTPMVAAPDTFHWTGEIAAGKWIEISAAHADITAELSTSSTVEITAIRRSGAAGSYRITLGILDGSVKACAVAVTAPDDPKQCDQLSSGEVNAGVTATRVDFLVRLPAGVGLAAHTGRGNVVASGVQSYVWATSRRGDIRIVTTDVAEASTDAGSISASFGRSTWRQNLEFLAEEGNVTVTAPGNAGMALEAETSAGRVSSEFPGQRAAKFGSGQRIMGRTGTGRGMLTLRTGRGDVVLRRGSPAAAETDSSAVDYSDTPSSAGDAAASGAPAVASSESANPERASTDAASPGPTGELLPVTVPAGLLDRFSDAAIRGWPDAPAIQRFRDIAATHVRQHPNDYVRERAEWALTLVRNGELLAPVRTALASDDWRERAYAAWVLGEMRDPRAVPALRTSLADQHWRVRMHAAAGLTDIGGPESVDPLIAALNDEYWQVRIAAVDALGGIGDRRAIPSLRSVASRDPREIVRSEAQDALARMR